MSHLGKRARLFCPRGGPRCLFGSVGQQHRQDDYVNLCDRWAVERGDRLVGGPDGWAPARGEADRLDDVFAFGLTLILDRRGGNGHGNSPFARDYWRGQRSLTNGASLAYGSGAKYAGCLRSLARMPPAIRAATAEACTIPATASRTRPACARGRVFTAGQSTSCQSM